jgi:hypothetical protein
MTGKNLLWEAVGEGVAVPPSGIFAVKPIDVTPPGEWEGKSKSGD